MAKKDEIKIPEEVLNRANADVRRGQAISDTDIAENSPMGLYSGKGSVDTSRVPDVGSVGFSRIVDKSSFDQGRTEQIVSPYGFASTTLTRQQVEQRAQARQQAEQMGTMPRTPEQQQALIDNIRKNAPALNQQRADWLEGGIAEGRALSRARREAGAYNFGTDATGRPLKQFAEQQAKEDAKMLGSRQAPQSTVTMFPSVVSSGRFETANSFKPSESFTGSIASNYAPPTTSGFGNRTRMYGEKRNSSPMSEGVMSAFDLGMSVVPSYMPNVIPQNNAIAMGMNQSPFGSPSSFSIF
jgi:hypothetical protein